MTFTLRLLLCSYLVLTLSGCAVYLTSSVATTVVTGKALSDHAVSGVTGYDCNSLYAVRKDHQYICEQRRDEGTHYPRSF